MLDDLIKACKKDRKGLILLKRATVALNQLELAAKIRDIEKNSFPETEEIKLAKEQAKKLRDLFGMVKLDIPEEMCWLISETLKVHNKKKGSFSLNDAAKLISKNNELFFVVD